MRHLSVLAITMFAFAMLALSPGVNASESDQGEATASVDRVPVEPIHQNAYRYYVEGLVAEGFSDFKEAGNSYRKAYQYHPDSYELGMAYARVLYRLGDPDKVLTLLERVSPQDPALLELKAACLRNLGRNKEAKEAYVRMVMQDSTAIGAYSFLASWYSQLDNTDSTIWAYQNMRRLQPGNHRILNELARAYNLNDQFAEARETYLASIAASSGPENARAVVSLASLYEQDQLLDSARIVLKMALDSDPENVNLHREVIRLYLAEDSLIAALPHVKQIADSSPGNRLAQRHVGIVYFSVDSLRLADSVFNHLIEQGDEASINLFYMGRISLAREDYQKASEQLAQLVQLEDSLYDNWSALAFAYRQLDRPEDEIATYRSGLDHMANEGAAVQMLFALGAAYERTDQVDSAISAFEQILEHHPRHAASLNYLGYTLADRGIRLDYAKNLLTLAVELQPNNAAFLDSYGWVFFKLGQYDSAVQYLSQAANLDSDPVIYDHLGDAYHSSGDTKKAREWWQKALEQDPENVVIREKLER